MVKSMEADDLMHLTIKKDGNGWAICLDDKKLHHVEGYCLENSSLPGAAKLSIEMFVNYP